MADPADIADAKQQLRDALLARRRVRSEAERSRTDGARTSHLLDFLGSVENLTVASYLSIEPEPDTTELVASLFVGGATVLLPVISPRGSSRMSPDWAPYTGPDQLREGRWGIPEPSTEPLGIGALATVDVVLVSALATTPDGWRLGVGGGWFDRALPHRGPATVTVALISDDEVFATLPHGELDEPVDVLATESGLRPTSRLSGLIRGSGN